MIFDIAEIEVMGKKFLTTESIMVALRKQQMQSLFHPRFESVVKAEDESFLWRLDDYPWVRNVWNIHPEYEIHLIRKSTGTAYVGDHIGQFAPGYLVVVGSGLPHDWISHMAPGESIKGRDIVLQFDPELLRRAGSYLPEFKNIEHFLFLALRGILLKGETARRGAAMLEEMGDAQGMDRLGRFFQLLGLFATSEEFEVLSSPDFEHDMDPEALGLIQQSWGYVLDNFTQDIRLPELAAKAGMTASTFSRFFQRNTGRSFTEHLASLRIGRACKLLAETQKPITDVCFEVGYANLSNFNRKFLELRGKTPSAYRKESHMKLRHQKLTTN
jgi:AraC-like DNA-binding protein